jgi:hypothetical protein
MDDRLAPVSDNVPPPRRPGPGFARAASAAIVLLALAVVAGICWASLLRDPSVRVERRGELWYPVSGRFAGNRACRTCHPAIVDRQEASAHATRVRRVRPGAPLGPYVTGQEVGDPQTGAIYQVRYHEGRNELFLRAGSLSAGASIVWEFGSGRRAHGYILRTEDGEYVDCRLNWYRSTQAWDFASGQDKLNRILIQQPLGRSLPPAEVARCFGCHSSEIWASGATPQGVAADRLQFRFEKGQSGLNCESCHGPRAAHAAAFERGDPVPPAPKMTAGEMNRLCARCHGKATIDPAHDVLARFQPWSLERSRCFIESQGRLSCTSCHDPHDNARTDAAFYDSRCVSCHSPAGRAEKLALRLCPVNRTSGCTSCHMPKDDQGMLHVTLTDHRIRIVRPGAGAESKGGAPAKRAHAKNKAPGALAQVTQ